MLRYLRNRKAQSLIEYALILGAIIVAVLFMQLYVRRAVQGKLREASDDMAPQFSPAAKYNFNVTTNSKITEKMDEATGKVTTKYDKDETSRSGNETLQADNQEWWP